MPKAGELWLAEIPFTSGVASKLRPVLVLWEDMADVVVAAVTKAAPRSLTDVPLHDWASEGLVVPPPSVFPALIASSSRCCAADWGPSPRLMRAWSKRPGRSTPSCVSIRNARLLVRAAFVERFGLWRRRRQRGWGA